MSRHAPLGLGLLIGGFLLVWFLGNADLSAVAARVGGVRPGFLVAAVALSLAAMVYRAWRWQGLMAPLGRVPTRMAVSCVFMGWALTALLPGRLGEMGRPILLGRRTGLSPSALLGTVVVERLLDTLMVLLLLGVYLTWFPLAFGGGSGARALNLALRTGGLSVLAVMLGGVGAVIVARRLPSSVSRALRRLAARLPSPITRRGWPLLQGFGVGLASAWRSASPSRQILVAVAHTLMLWTGLCGVHVLLFQALGLDLPFSAVLPLMSMIVIGVLVPIPAAVGSYHNIVQLGLTTLLGVPDDLAISYAIVSHAVAYLPSVSIGLILLAWHGRLTLLVDSESAVADATTVPGPPPPDRA